MLRKELRARRPFAAGFVFVLLGLARPSAALPPARASDPVPDAGKNIASDDDASAIAVNPANLAFLPSWELRWNTTWTGDASRLPNRGHEFDGAFPFLMFATGLRVDVMDPPTAAPAPFTGEYRWIRWDIALRASELAALGFTFGWSNSNVHQLDGMFSATTGVTSRPFPWLSLAVVARDWNTPRSLSGFTDQRRYDLGFAVRPFLSRAVDVGFEAELYEHGAAVPRATLGVDLPRVGRLRGDLALLDPTEGKDFAATAGLDLNLGQLQLSGGGVFGDAYTKSGTGFFAGAAIRGYREPGVHFPARVVRIRIKDTPGVRGHVKLLQRLWRIAQDPEIEGLELVIKAEPAGSLAHAEELADAIRLVRGAGKKVLCHLEDAEGKALYVCANADRIAMNPAGGLHYTGVHGTYFYFGGLLKKLGVRADFVRIGAHKLAAEEITSPGGSDVAELDHQELIDQYQGLILRDVAAGRHMTISDLKQRLAKGPFIAPEAREQGLVDTLAYEDEVDRASDEMMGRHVPVVDDETPTRAPNRWGDADKVGVVYLHGDMVDGESQHIPFIDVRLAGSYTIARALKKMREDASVKAVVFRIETGGGSSLAADVILREAQLLAKKKPLIVSMGTYAASGGYYASVAAKEIFANPGTVTGSIGIFYGKVDVVGLLDKFGVHVESFRSSPRADAESFFRPFTDDERKVLGEKVKQFYDLFVGRVAEGRHMTPDAVDAIARGKVWTGQQALQNGLVDKLGGLRQALQEARHLAHLPDSTPFIEAPDEDDSILGFLLKSAGLSVLAGQAQIVQAIVPPAFLSMARALSPFMIYDANKPLARVEMMEEAPHTAAGDP